MIIDIYNNVLPQACEGQTRGGSRVWKEGGHLAEKKLSKKKKKKVTTIIASYPLPNILYHVCYVK